MVANLFSQKGTVLESCDPYVDSDVNCKTTCAYQKTVLDWWMINGNTIPDPNVLKAYIYTYGPVYTPYMLAMGISGIRSSSITMVPTRCINLA